MLDLGFVRTNLELVEKKLRERGQDPAALLGDFRELDQHRREVVHRAHLHDRVDECLERREVVFRGERVLIPRVRHDPAIVPGFGSRGRDSTRVGIGNDRIQQTFRCGEVALAHFELGGGHPHLQRPVLIVVLDRDLESIAQ